MFKRIVIVCITVLLFFLTAFSLPVSLTPKVTSSVLCRDVVLTSSAPVVVLRETFTGPDSVTTHMQAYGQGRYRIRHNLQPGVKIRVSFFELRNGVVEGVSFYSKTGQVPGRCRYYFPLQ